VRRRRTAFRVPAIHQDRLLLVVDGVFLRLTRATASSRSLGHNRSPQVPHPMSAALQPRRELGPAVADRNVGLLFGQAPGPGQVHPEQVRRVQPGPGQVRLGEVGPGQVRRVQPGPGQVRLGEVGPGQVRPVEDGPGQVLMVEDCFSQVRSAKACLGELRP
jgi:hypothetical protein